MTDLVVRDPFRRLMPFPRWFDDFDDTAQRGLKIHENDSNIVVEAVVAGVPSDNVEIDIEDGVVTIKADSTEKSKSEEGTTTSRFQYYYTCALSGGKWEKAEADLEDGVLRLTIPKTESSRPRKVTVKTKKK